LEVKLVLPDKSREQPAIIKASSRLVVIAASAGGLQALTTLLSTLPKEFNPAIAIVLHSDPKRPSQLVEILKRGANLPIRRAMHGDVLQEGQVYIAPPDWHMLIDRDRTVILNQAGKVHFLRPSADVLFQSAADCYGKNLLAIVLTGTLSDGTIGAQAIKSKGGTVIVQDEATSDFFGMPKSVIKAGYADKVLPIQGISAAMVDWSNQESTDDCSR
jgi:two-component system chemotaxis response regulator CheB